MQNYSLLTLLISSVVMRQSVCAMASHIKCRGGTYPRSQIQRFPVPDEKVSWSVDYKKYDPPSHTSPGLKGKPWADPELDDSSFQPKWNNIDGKVNRVSHTGKYEIQNGFPLNPVGRTGIQGRGVLGKWGPNHAADPVVRWKMNCDGNVVINSVTNKPILQFVAVKRGDTGEWALPGGMVDPGEKVSAAAVREFQEEATNSLTMTDDEKSAWQKKFKRFFSEGDEVYRGYVDDIRNTDNAWMETIAYNFHDDTGDTVGALSLQAGDDAVGVKWLDIDNSLVMYGSHKDIVKTVAIKRNSHW